ncbi:MAG: glutaminyl-peptide cyclotransferase [Bacteroidales bacterium]|nr:glutaminyl-peptide cyclotransferase [Bacteroidales bacterium]
MRKFVSIFIVSYMLMSCGDAKVREYRVETLAEYPHDTASYTQGLFFQDGRMYESTGQFGSSTFREVDLSSGEPLQRLNFSDEYFIEGSVMFDGNLYILTWTNRKAFIYDAGTLKYKSTWSYPREGWGITTDGKNLIASDGSANLYYMDGNFAPVKKITVKLEGRPVRYLNELEYIDGKIWANVYMTDTIVIIDPKDGNVEGVVDCTGLLPRKLRKPSTDVLNGIAYDKKTDKIYLTGKNWPKLYEVRLIEK